MNDEVIVSAEQATPDWLTTVLRRSGALSRGSVKAVEVLQTQNRELSSTVTLQLTYETASSGELPERLFLKMVAMTFDNDEPLLSSEVDYYGSDYSGVVGVPIMRSYDAALSLDLQRYHVLIDDVSHTHVRAFEEPLTLEHGLALAEGLAAMHAHWWGAERLAEAGKPIPSPEAIVRFVAFGRAGVDHILECCVKELAPHWPDTILDLYEHHPQLLIDRTRDPTGFTLIHGDAGPGNVLVPINADRPVYLIDRAPFEWSLTTWLGVYDLAYAMVTGLPVASRRELEDPLLRRYHVGLVERGVDSYPWQQLHQDYRLTAAMGVYVATEWCRGSGRQYKDIWMPMLRQALTAVDDLQSAQLWQAQ